MRQILLSAGTALFITITLTPVLIRVFARRGFGQEIRIDGPASHHTKRGTPTMGGLAIGAGVWGGYLGSHLIGTLWDAPGPSASGVLVLLLASALGVVGFLDDSIKLRKHRNLGLTAAGKYLGQISAAVVFAVLVLRFPGATGLTPAGRNLSYVRDIPTITFASLFFVLFVVLLVVAWSNAVNITDGLDGLAAGSMTLTLGAYVVITLWQYDHSCEITPGRACYTVRDPLDLAMVSAAGAAACVGFLWWNAAPAKIFMGDTGSLGLGGLLAGLSITSHTELLAVVLGGLFVAEIMSVVLQIVVFRTTHTRLFRMAPFHHHFELDNWPETTVIIRFWVLAGIASATGLCLFYSEYLTSL
ncbi:phospho-N-acetylmuramoyl-pentapeptide-transferase [Nocardia caishijiensis]|uniref:Phospho-N-acetylmuramoyl-pentapeptide-transferase n=1 Tax=Nocardia caishijiensis TaxID=184756 RepID=A0ABQ6YPX7_9NOCA|nr:phospho-N-acetylmuramoyl-pentapeptide-transferase [Nocardia caishijiensis]KAF0847564.1 phospho-N-acetylmuramoyl-pentapeptide-transferase [Nocardia caishijiensis]